MMTVIFNFVLIVISSALAVHYTFDLHFSVRWILVRHSLSQGAKTQSFFLFFYFFSRLFTFETEHERGRVRERGRHRIWNRLQALSRQPTAWRGARTHGLRDHDLSQVGRLTDWATQAPQNTVFLDNLGERQPAFSELDKTHQANPLKFNEWLPSLLGLSLCEKAVPYQHSEQRNQVYQSCLRWSGFCFCWGFS